MRVAIVGAGAVGCYLAARLLDRSHEVILVGRPDQVDAIARDGLEVRDHRGETRRYRAPAVLAVPALTERPDLVLLTVKTQDVAQACQDIRPYTDGTPVVAMQNGVRSDHIAGDILGQDTVVGAVVMCAVTYLQPGRVSVDFPGWLILGEPFGPPRPRTWAVVGLLNSCVPTFYTHRLAAVRWSKLISNLNNALSAVTGLTLPEIVGTLAGYALPVWVMREGYRIVHAAGMPLDHGLYGLTPRAVRRDPNAALVAVLQATMTTLLARLPERAAVAVLSAAATSRLNRLPIRGSTWQSIARGRPSEVDYLNGEIVRLGERLGMATPFNRRLVDMTHQVERTGQFLPIEALLSPLSERAAGASTIGGAR